MAESDTPRISVVHPPGGRGPVVLVVGGPIAPADIPGLCARVPLLLGPAGAGLVVCDVSGLAPDAVTIDALARVQLTVRQLGGEIRLRNACDDLRGMVDLMGLHEALPPCSGRRAAVDRLSQGAATISEEPTDSDVSCSHDPPS
ncbi:MAG: hypothetical protein ACRDJO_09150 [Actinomycetota bacterium]